MVSKKQQKKDRRRKTVNFFGAVAYLSVVMQWVLALALFLPFIGNLSLLNPEPLPDTPETVVVAPAEPSDPTLITFIGIAGIVLIMLGITAYVMARIPVTLARTGRKVVHESSSVITRATIKVSGKKSTKKLRDSLTPIVTLAMKALIVLLPMAITFSYRLTGELTIDPDTVLFASALIANISFALFSLQYCLAYLLSVKRADIW